MASHSKFQQAALTSARTPTNSIYCLSHLQAQLDLQPGIPHADIAEDKHYATAHQSAAPAACPSPEPEVIRPPCRLPLQPRLPMCREHRRQRFGTHPLASRAGRDTRGCRVHFGGVVSLEGLCSGPEREYRRLSAGIAQAAASKTTTAARTATKRCDGPGGKGAHRCRAPHGC